MKSSFSEVEMPVQVAGQDQAWVSPSIGGIVPLREGTGTTPSRSLEQRLAVRR